jgi:hypothetical protein
LKNRSENLAGRGQILPVLQGNSRSIAQKSGEIWTGQANLQPISFKSDRLLAKQREALPSSLSPSGREQGERETGMASFMIWGGGTFAMPVRR